MNKNMIEIKFDEKNANKHTPKGLKLLEKSIKKLGFGRSIVVDKDGYIICGNGVYEVAEKLRKNKMKIVETNGDELVVVQRKDLSINELKGRSLSIADNQTALINIEFDYDKIVELSNEFNYDFDKEWFGQIESNIVDGIMPDVLNNYDSVNNYDMLEIKIVLRSDEKELLENILGFELKKNKTRYELNEILMLRNEKSNIGIDK